MIVMARSESPIPLRQGKSSYLTRPTFEPLADVLLRSTVVVDVTSRYWTFSQCLKHLKSDDAHSRWHACLRIKETAKIDQETAKTALPELIEAFEKYGPLTKSLIAEVLAEIRDVRSLRALRKAYDEQITRKYLEMDTGQAINNELCQRLALAISSFNLVEEIKEIE